jgi:putative transposase
LAAVLSGRLLLDAIERFGVLHEVQLIADNYATHQPPKVKAWLARHPRFHLHHTPTYASWLNQLERWFALITQQAIRRGSFRSVRDLVRKIDSYVTHYNTHKRPFAWTATAAFNPRQTPTPL